MNFNKLKSNIILLQIVAVIVFLVLSVVLILKKDIDIDECYTLNTISQGFLRTITQSIHFEGQLPFYFLTVHLFSYINDSLFFIRFISSIFILINFFVIYKLCKYYFKQTESFVIAIYFLFHPYSLYIGSFARSYALLSTAILISFFLLIKIYHYRDKIPNKLLIGFILVNIIGLQTHYYYLFYFGSIGLYIIFRLKNRISRKLLLVSVLSGLTIIPYFLFYFLSQFNLHADHINVTYDFKNSSLMFLGKLKSYFISTDRVIISIPFMLFTVALLGISFYKHSYKKLYNNPFFIILMPQLFLFLITYVFFGDMLAHQKHGVAIFLFINLVFIYFMFITFKKYGLLLLSCFIILNVFLTLRMLKLNKFSYLQQAVNTIEIEESEDEPILVFPNEFAETFTFYYNGSNKVIAIPTEIKYETYKDSSYILTDKLPLEKFFTKDTLWLFTINYGSFQLLGMDYNKHFLDNYIIKNYDVGYNKVVGINKIIKLYRKSN